MPDEQLYVVLDRETGLYYRGAKLWRWTRFKNMAAYLTRSRWDFVAKWKKWEPGRYLIFDAPPDRWPRGKHNGQRIVGVSVKVSVDVTFWLWKPYVSLRHGMIHWLCFRSWWLVEYDQFERRV